MREEPLGNPRLPILPLNCPLVLSIIILSALLIFYSSFIRLIFSFLGEKEKSSGDITLDVLSQSRQLRVVPSLLPKNT